MRLLSFLLIGSTAFSQAFAEAASVTPLEPLSTPYLTKLTLGLIVVVAIIFGLSWLLKKLNLSHQSQTGLIKIVSSLALGTRDRILLIQVGEEQILIGLTAGRMQKLHTLAEPLKLEMTETPSNSFSKKISQLMDAGKSQ